MNNLHSIGFDVHKKTVRFCVKTAAGEIVEEGRVAAQREVLRQWASARLQSGFLPSLQRKRASHLRKARVGAQRIEPMVVVDLAGGAGVVVH